MVRRVSRWEQRRRMLGWAKYSLALAVIFSALGLETYINNQLRLHDYEQNTLSSQIRALENELIEIQVQAASYQNVDMLASQAINMAMVETRPNQVVHITAPGQEPVLLEHRSGDVLARVRPWDSMREKESLREPLLEGFTATAAVIAEPGQHAAPSPMVRTEAPDTAIATSLTAMDEDPALLLGSL